MLIGMHGPKLSGKDTAFLRLREITGDGLNSVRVSFADALYRSAAAALGVTVEELQKWKTMDNIRLQVVDDIHGNVYVDINIREYLQKYGKEAHRDVFGGDFFVDFVLDELYPHQGTVKVVTDVRFPNEADAIHHAGGVVAMVVGPADLYTGDAHASEHPLDTSKIDYILVNDRRDTYEPLDASLRGLLQEYPNLVNMRMSP